MVRKDVIEIAKKLYQNGAKITLVTNGYLLDKKIDICKYLKRINLSIHTLNRESYEKIVCVKNTYNKVIENIKNVRKLYPNIEIRLNSTLVKGVNWSDEELNKLIEFSKEIKASIKFTELFPQKQEECVKEEEVIKKIVKYGYSKENSNNNNNRSKAYKKENHEIFLTRCVCATAKLVCRMKNMQINFLEELKNNNTQGLLDKIIMAKKKINKDECNRCLKAI